ncbi:uncharacterized protein C8Q71DRAFT_389138 [Rhodofomes roseus]|uniref:Uncharacterized protein n=1 Tax=Rhodofomes roseus TaxID=34475 RepID=A0ABQ8JZL8_9APHY|nr:uncharacterized protein C8Q71DRAFT_389138 [Rhodofomes roseus]KAH9829823.1 hypothetical protein C8Q71DRAFT_389138 [Rhodofomes roseus]
MPFYPGQDGETGGPSVGRAHGPIPILIVHRPHSAYLPAASEMKDGAPGSARRIRARKGTHGTRNSAILWGLSPRASGTTLRRTRLLRCCRPPSPRIECLERGGLCPRLSTPWVRPTYEEQKRRYGDGLEVGTQPSTESLYTRGITTFGKVKVCGRISRTARRQSWGDGAKEDERPDAIWIVFLALWCRRFGMLLCERSGAENLGQLDKSAKMGCESRPGDDNVICSLSTGVSSSF